ncbi:MAG: hypothetical protein KDC98_00305 [Planctomycetes bacterium]|nr:hypothetical protein [Planctomycetota bacterium]
MSDDWLRPDAAICDRIVSVDRDGDALTLGTLWRQAAAIAALLPEPRPGSQVAFAFGSDRRAFAAALLGTWLAGHTAALPENGRREYVVPVLDHEDTVAFLQDTGVGRGHCVPRLLRSCELPPLPARWQPAPTDLALATFTTVAIGEVQALRWTHAEMRNAAERVAATLPLQRDRTFVAALLPSYVPALFGGLLAPLAAGARFGATSPRTRDEALAAIAAGTATGLLAPRTWLHSAAAWPVPAVAAEDLGRDLGLAAESRLMADRLADPGAEPRDENGRLAHEELCLLLGLGRDGQPIEHALSWQRVDPEPGDDAQRFRTTLPARYAFFEGHFVSYPVLCGAAQLHELVLPCLRAIDGSLTAVEKLTNVKFQARIAPGDRLEVVLQPTATARAFDFEIRRGETRCSSGRIAFASGADQNG